MAALEELPEARSRAALASWYDGILRWSLEQPPTENTDVQRQAVGSEILFPDLTAWDPVGGGKVSPVALIS
jgi:hypothetical protein